MQAAMLGVDASLILLHNNCNVAAAGSVSPVAPCLPGPAGGEWPRPVQRPDFDLTHIL